MSKTGILLHVYHLEARGWEKLVWGDPARDRLGSGTLLIKMLLDTPADQDVVSVVYSGPSQRDGLTEGAYTKRFLLERVGQLAEFPSLRMRLDRLTPAEYVLFKQRLEELVVGPVIRNTLAEITTGAEFFAREDDVRFVYQLAVPSHAPRCLLNQLIARRDGSIPAGQMWCVLGADVPYEGTELEDGYIVEAPHRGDDPMIDYKPGLAAVLREHYYTAGPDGAAKQRIVQAIMAASQKPTASKLE